MSQEIKGNHNHEEKKNVASVSEEMVRKYIDLFNRLPIGIYRTTPDGKILTANPAFMTLLGYSTVYDLEGINLNKTHKSPEARLAFIREIEEKNEVYAKESVLVDSNGNEVIVEEYAKGYKNEAGEILFFEGIVIDITQKVRDRERIVFLNNFKELIFNLSTSFINIRLNDIDDQIVFSLKSIGEFINADRSYVFLFDDNEMRRMSNTHEWVADGVSSVFNELQDVVTANYPWWMDNLRKNKAVIIPNVNDLPESASNEKEIYRRQSILSLFAVPMFFDYQLIGFLGFDMVRTYKVITDDIVELLEIAASLFANILNYQKTESKAIEGCKQLEKLVQRRTHELKIANEHLKMIAENSNDVLWTTDMNLKTTYISPSVLKYLGYTAEEYAAMPLEKRYPPESLEKMKGIYATELAKIKNGKISPEEHPVIFEMLHYHRNGQQIWGEVSINFIFDQDGNPKGIHGITRNIHERKSKK